MPVMIVVVMAVVIVVVIVIIVVIVVACGTAVTSPKGSLKATEAAKHINGCISELNKASKTNAWRALHGSSAPILHRTDCSA